MAQHTTPRPENPTFKWPSNSKPDDWAAFLGECYGVQYVTAPEDLPDQKAGDDVLWTSRCSRTKTGKDKAVPKEFYVSNLNMLFYHMMEKQNLRYGILSDLYGLHMDDEELDFYDIHPSSLTFDQKAHLGKLIGEKAKARGYDELVFYNTSPMMSRPYFEMLWHSGLKVWYVTSLGLLDQLYGTQAAPPKGKAKAPSKASSKPQPGARQLSLFNMGGTK